MGDFTVLHTLPWKCKCNFFLLLRLDRSFVILNFIFVAFLCYLLIYWSYTGQHKQIRLSFHKISPDLEKSSSNGSQQWVCVLAGTSVISCSRLIWVTVKGIYSFPLLYMHIPLAAVWSEKKLYLKKDIFL